MGRSDLMRLLLVLALVAAATSLVASLPLEGEPSSLLQVSTGLFPQGDDQATVTAEVNEAIQHDVNMDDIGEAPEIGDHATDWEKKAAADINAMSRGAIAEVNAKVDDPITDKFQRDADEAKKIIAGPKKKATTESEIEREADEALKDPSNAKKLKQDAEKAEVDLESGFIPTPVEFIDEGSDQDDDLGEDDDDSQFALLGGSEADVAKAITAQITQKVNLQLGNMPDSSEDTAALQTFEEDKAEAEKFLAMKQKKRDANKKIMEEMAAAQKELNQSKESTQELDSRENNEEKKEAV